MDPSEQMFRKSSFIEVNENVITASNSQELCQQARKMLERRCSLEQKIKYHDILIKRFFETLERLEQTEEQKKKCRCIIM